MNLPRKVLHVLNSASGGAALSTLALIDALRGIDVDSVAVCHSAGLASDFDKLRDAVRGNLLVTPLYWWNKKIRSKLWKRPLLELRQLYLTGFVRGSTRQVAKFAELHGADLIHSNTILTLEGGYAARILGLPHVWHLRELVGSDKPFCFYRNGHGWGQFVGRYADAVIANSHTSAASVAEWLPSEKLEIVPNGIDINPFMLKANSQTDFKIVVGVVGNLTSSVKRHDRVVDVATAVDRNLPIEWRFYGHDPSQGGKISAGPYLDNLHAKIDHANLRSRFRFMNHVADPSQIMREIDVLIHTAEHESFGRIIVEAMAAGLPVVGVRGGGLSEIVIHEKTGLLFDCNDFAGMAKAVEQFATSAELRSQYGHAGRQRAEQVYSIEACAQGVTRVYDRVMSNRRSGTALANAVALQPASS